MSESSKMGLFGSKDESAETNVDKTEPEGPEQNAYQRCAPYNIDSDSETYDTEALSMMDINDIIGIQSESAGDSTLESEFAALSEVITDIKSDEVAEGIQKGQSKDAEESHGVGRSGSNRDIGSTEDKGSRKDSPKEDARNPADERKSAEFAGMAGINKSLQLIGEAYISDDSQDTDSDETPDAGASKSLSPSENVGESRGEDAEAVAKNSSEAVEESRDEAADTATKDSSESVATIEEKAAPECTTADEQPAAEVAEAAEPDKNAGKSTEPLGENKEGANIEKWNDTTDSSSTGLRTKQSEPENEIVSMDVDSTVAEIVPECVLAENQSPRESDHSETPKKLSESPKTELPSAETLNLPNEPVADAEEPMEVDQPIDQPSHEAATEKIELVVAKETSDDKTEPLATEEPEIASDTIGQPEESKKSIEERPSDVETSSELEIHENPSSDKISEAEPSNLVKNVETTENIVEEAKQTSDNLKAEKIDLEIENNDSPVKSIEEKVETNIFTEKIAKAGSESSEQPRSATEADDPKCLPKNSSAQREISTESFEPPDEIRTRATTLTALDDEPMEVDDNAEYRKSESDKQNRVCTPDLSSSSLVAAQPAAVIAAPLKESTSDEPMATNSSENIETCAPLLETSSDVAEPVKIATNSSESIETRSSLLKNSSDVAEPVKIATNSSESIETRSSLLKNSSDVAEPVKIATNSSESIETSSSLLKNSSDVAEPVKIATNSSESIETRSSLLESSSDVAETAKIAPEKCADETGVAKLSEEPAETGEPAANIAFEESTKIDTSVAPKLSENCQNSGESVPVDKPNESASDKDVVSEVEAPQEPSTMVEAMETELTEEQSSPNDELPPNLSEKSSNLAENVSHIIPSESSVSAAEEIAPEDEQMEVDAGVKKEKLENDSEICRADEPSPEPAETSSSAPLHAEEKLTTENLEVSSKAKDSEDAEEAAEEALEITSEAENNEACKIEATENIDETDEAGQESKEDEDEAANIVQAAESLAQNIPKILAKEPPDAAAPKDEKEFEPESKTEHEKSKSSTEQSSEDKITKALSESAEMSAEGKEPEAKESEPQISTAAPEASLEKIPEIEKIEIADEAADENVDETTRNTQPIADEPEPLTSSEKSESIESSESSSPGDSPGENAEDEEAEAAALRKEEEEKQCLASIEKLDSPAMSSGCDLSEAFVALIQNEQDSEEAEAESEGSQTSKDNPIDAIPEAEPPVEDAKEESKSSSAEATQNPQIFAKPTDEPSENFNSEKSQEASEKSVEIDQETSEKFAKTDQEASEKFAEIEQETSEKSAESDQEAVESASAFSKQPESPQQAGNQSDLSSSSMPVDDLAEDPVEEEMNLSLDPETLESQEPQPEEDASETAPRGMRDLSIEERIDAEEAAQQADRNLSSVSEQPDELPSVQDEPLESPTVDDFVDESIITSAAEKPEQSDERLEKPTEDDDENSKDALLPAISCEPQIFHDEQSQNTQEMMDSILETDSSNLNKILDDEEGVGAALACANDLPLEEAEIDELAEKLPSESEELLNKALDDPMSSQNIDSLEGLLDLDLIQEADESTLKSVDPIVAKVMNEADEDIETKDVDVSLLLEVADQTDREDYENAAINASGPAPTLSKVVEDAAEEIATPVESLLAKSAMDQPIVSSATDHSNFELSSVEPEAEADRLASEQSKLELAEDLLMEIAVDEERKMLAGKLLLDKDDKVDLSDDLLLRAAAKESKIDLSNDLMLQTPEEPKVDLPPEVLLTAAAAEAESRMELVEEVLLENSAREDPKMVLTEDISLERVVRDQVLTAAAEMEDLPGNSEISELESAVKFLQESEEQDMDSPLVLSPKMVDSVVEEIARDEDVGIFVTDGDICADPSALVAELESIIPDPIAISEAEIISEAAKLESERKSKLREEAELQSPISTRQDERKELVESTPPFPTAEDVNLAVLHHPETPKTHRVTLDVPTKLLLSEEKIETAAPLLKKSAPIPKMSILEERLKEPPKIEIPSVGESVSRICEMPTTPKTSLLIQRDAKLSSFQKMLESPKSSEKTELKIVDTPRKDSDKHEFENVGSPRIILKIAKSAIADCAEPRSPKSPKIRSATNSPNPEDSPGQKLGKIKLKLSKSGHPSIITSDKVEEVSGQWHTEGASSLSPLGMKIKFSKTGDVSIVQTEKHEVTEDAKEPPKHKFEEAKRTESPIGMKIKFSKTGDASIVQQDGKDSTSKHKDKHEMMMQSSPKRNESPIGMKIKFSKSGDASIIQPETSDDREGATSRTKDKLDVPQDTPRRTESPLGMKFKLFKTGDASIVASEIMEDSPQETKRTDSPLGVKIKLSKTRGGASIVPNESSEELKERLDVQEAPRRTESPLGMKIKFSKSGGDASIIHTEDAKEIAKHKEPADSSQSSSSQPSDTSIAVKIKVNKLREGSALLTEVTEEPESLPTAQKRTESSIGMKFKLSKTGDASIVHSEVQDHHQDDRSKEKLDNVQESSRKSDATIGMKIKLSKTGDASIIQAQPTKKLEDSQEIDNEHQRSLDSTQTMKMKLQRSADGSPGESEKKEKSTRRKDTESPLEMKIKLSKTGHPTIVACDNYGESSQRAKDTAEPHKHKDSSALKEMPGMKMLKSMHTAGIHGNRAELTIEPIQMQSRKSEAASETSPKRKDITISPIESKKAKLEAKLSQMLPEVTIQPIMPREQKQMMFEGKASSISRQQMNVISQEISITQVRSNKAMDLSMTNKLKSMLAKNAPASASADCEIIEHRPELIIVNENSNSSQDVMIIEEVPALRSPDAKVPKKRGRPRRNPLPLVLAKPAQQQQQQPLPMPGNTTVLPRDPLALDEVPQLLPHPPPPTPTTMIVPQTLPPKENERPKRSCSRQKSYAPPKRGRRRGGGRGKRKIEHLEHMDLSKKSRIEQDLSLLEQSTTSLVTIDETPLQPEMSHNTSELYKALRQPPMDHKLANAIARVEAEQAVNDADLLDKGTRESLMDSRLMSHLDGVMGSAMGKPTEHFDAERKMSLESLGEGRTISGQLVSDTMETMEMEKVELEKAEMMSVDEKTNEKTAADEMKDGKDTVNTPDHQNWLTPSSKKLLDVRNEGNISSVQVIDEETRMSAESSSRSQTPARNMSVQAPETIVNEESQGSVLSTATTESEKVKVKNRRMEINFDPDEGPFTVDKVAEYEWPLDPTRKSETFMIQEQISQYLGVKSFKRKYPDLKRRMVDMEERNYLRENALVSESMCDMGLTAVSSSEVLDVMCNDFPDQYEEYRKYIREKQMKEHSKKQKELTAAANAERNRIDLAEMAVQSALSWNVGLNKARRESRKCSLDLQTFTIHVPKKQQKVEEESRQSHYPVALIPGQYTDYYREYTPAELRYYPLNTVLYGPMKPNERKLDSQSEGSQSDSDSDSSSDDSSSSSSDGTQDTEESQSTMDEVDVELSRQKEDMKSIKCKMCLKHLNKFGKTEVLIQCGTCNGYVHPSCIDLTLDMVPHIQAYAWQCTDCKTCAQCHDPADEDKMLFCDMCDRGYHIYCVGLRRVPQGRWHCQECAVCASCGSREAGGANSDRNSVAQWQHEYKKGDKNTRVYVSTLCVPCSKLWRKGRYCPHCSRCHTVPRLDLEANLVHCSACDKYLHLGCVESKDLTIDRKNYLCDFCQPSRQQMVKPLVSKVFRT